MVRERVVRHEVAVRGDLAQQIAARLIPGPRSREAPARHEEDRLQTAAIELLEDERRAVEIGAVVERQQQLARRAGR